MKSLIVTLALVLSIPIAAPAQEFVEGMGKAGVPLPLSDADFQSALKYAEAGLRSCRDKACQITFTKNIQAVQTYSCSVLTLYTTVGPFTQELCLSQYVYDVVVECGPDSNACGGSLTDFYADSDDYFAAVIAFNSVISYDFTPVKFTASSPTMLSFEPTFSLAW